MAAIFKKGFKIGFGDSQKRINTITAGIKDIGKNLKEIFTDTSVITAADGCANAIALSFGKINGAMTSVGLTIGANLIGGFAQYLAKNSSYIREKGKEILDHFSEYLPKFKKVIPYDYNRMQMAIVQMEEKGLNAEQAQIEAFYASTRA